MTCNPSSTSICANVPDVLRVSRGSNAAKMLLLRGWRQVRILADAVWTSCAQGDYRAWRVRRGAACGLIVIHTSADYFAGCMMSIARGLANFFAIFGGMHVCGN